MKESVTNYFNEMIADITPVEFEKLCLQLLSETSDFSSLQNVQIEHSKICQAFDGTYQIDGYLEYQVLGVKIKVLIECKMYKKKIERKVVAELFSKIQSLGANKGIIMSTCGFQSGAQEFALAHGIALIQVVNGRLLNIQQSFNQI